MSQLSLKEEERTHMEGVWKGRGDARVRLPWWLRTSLVVQMVKHLPTMWETWLQSLGLENLLEKEMATHSSSLA